MLLGLLGCNLPVGIRLFPRPPQTPTPTISVTPTSAVPDAPLGSAENPVVLALPPSTRPQADVLDAGQVLRSLLEKATGYRFVSVIPPSEAELVTALETGNAHIASLSPFGYLLASEDGKAEAAFARAQQDGSTFYGAQFVARSDAGFTTYFDAIQDANLVDATVALAQLANKKPCWTDTFSPSGYVIPLGFLNEANVSAREPAFLSSHAAVVRAIYAGGICDFGATYVDARTYPGLDALPDVVKKIVVIWRIPAIIPYQTLVFASGMPVDMRRLLTRTFVDLMSTPEGKAAMQTLYGFSNMQVVQDGQFADFRKAAKASGLDLNTLLK
jgi:phosphate/phosphite/phosphonate ABC transporter binding protein